MRRNNTLAAAITATLTLTAGMAAYAGQFDNVIKDMPVFDTSVTGTSPQKQIPDPEFDFVGPSFSIVPSYDRNWGTSFASELFGSGTLILPTPSTGTGEYLAVVYTIDGTIDKSFEMTFSVNTGRFSAAAIGIRSSQLTAGTVVTSLETTACTMSAGLLRDTGVPTVDINQVFRLDSGTEIYQVNSIAGGYVTFWQLGNAGKCPTPGAVVGTTKSFLSTDSTESSGLRWVGNATTGGIVEPSTSILNVTSGYATIGLSTTKIASTFTPGWRYICAPSAASTPPEPAGGTSFANLFPVFEVKGTTTVAAGASDGLLVSVLPATTVGLGGNSQGGFASAGQATCDVANNTIYRVNVKGDTVLSVSNATNFIAGKSYKLDGGGTDAVAPYSNVHATAYRVTATDTTKNTITIEPALRGVPEGVPFALLHGEFAYDTAAFNTGGAWNLGNPIAAAVLGKPIAEAVNNSSFSVSLNAAAPGLTLFNNDQIMLLYKLTDLGVLAAAGEAVNISVDLKVPFIGVVVNPARQLTVAHSVQAVTTQISATPPTVFISVSSNMTQFKGTGISFENSYVARIGKLVISDASKAPGEKPVKEDGATPFKLDASGVLADSSKLTVSNGQFSASTKLPGKIYIGGDGISDIGADEVTMDSTGIWTATWNLNTTRLSQIVGPNNTEKETYIKIRSDGNTQINSNTEDQVPHAKLELKFNKAEYRQDITAEGDLLRIPRDGKLCTVYNVPPPTEGKYGADVLSVRITNGSSVSDQIEGTLISADGAVLYDGPLFDTELMAGATARLTNDDLAKRVATAWEGRAILRLKSNLPKMEVMALIRQQNVPSAPLSNLSTGAKGTSCE